MNRSLQLLNYGPQVDDLILYCTDKSLHLDMLVSGEGHLYSSQSQTALVLRISGGIQTNEQSHLQWVDILFV